LFQRPFTGVPIGGNDLFARIVPLDQFDHTLAATRSLQLGEGSEGDPARLPARFSEALTTPTGTDMTVGGAFFAQFVSHDLDLIREVVDELLVPPFVFRFLQIDGQFINRRTPGFDLDPVYRMHPADVPTQPGSFGPWDRANLRFRFEVNEAGAADYPRGRNKLAMMGDARDDESGVVARIHHAFMRLHNVQVDRILAREGFDESSIEFRGPVWRDVFNEARNYTTAYYQGLVCNELARQLTGRTLFQAAADRRDPVGPLATPHNVLEFAACAFRLHTLIPGEVRISSDECVPPIDERLRGRLSWDDLFGPEAIQASRLDAGLATSLRTITDLFVPGNPVPITLDLAQVNLLRGRETRLPGGEAYLRFLLAELGLSPASTRWVRGKRILDASNAETMLDRPDDAPLLADLQRGDTDLWAYIMLEADLNGGLLGPVGQDILERTWLALLRADDWSILGRQSDQFTSAQMAFFRSATFDRLIVEITAPGDVNRDHVADAADIQSLLRQWLSPGARFDLDGDGVTGAADLRALLTRWSP
jgi:hypothetical protein